METVAEQRLRVKTAFENTPMAKGSSWNVCSASWFKLWCRYVGYDGGEATGDAPGSIDNHVLLAGSSDQLKPGLMEGEHYVVMPRSVWDLLVGWYGGGPAVGRFVIEDGQGATRMLRVEVYLLRVRVKVCDKNGSFVAGSKWEEAYYSCKDRVGDMTKKECKRLQMDPDKTRVFCVDGGPEEEEGQPGEEEQWKETVLDDWNSTLEDAMVAQGQRLCLQACINVKHGKKEWPPLPSEKSKSGKKKQGFFSRLFGPKEHRDSSPNGTNGTSSAAASSSGKDDDREEDTKNGVNVPLVVMSESGGVCGLTNLGNTCFMNGALQALLHTEPLIHYFLSGGHKKELNKKNPLGMKGELAQAFGDLMKEVWRSSTNSVVTPKQLRHVVGKFAPQFQGYQQHDSHELLAFVLDGIHEDLNRVLEKQYVELVEPENVVSDAERAHIFWGYHEKRNRSVVVDHFHAQLKSTIVCPAPTDGGCGRTSVTFDPFASLSVPLPSLETDKRYVEVAVSRDPWLQDGVWFSEMPIKYSVEVMSGETIRELCNRLLELVRSDPSQKYVGGCRNGKSLVLTEHLQHKVYGMFQGSQPASLVSSRDLFFGFLLPSGSNEVFYSYLSFSHCKSYGGSMRHVVNTEFFGLPFMAAVSFDEPVRVLDVYRMAWRAMSCYVREGLWKTVGEVFYFDSDSPPMEQQLAMKIELQRKGPPEGSIPSQYGCWRVDNSICQLDGPYKGKMMMRYQVMDTPDKVDNFPFRIRWSCDSYKGCCLKCGERSCPGCDIAETADKPIPDCPLEDGLLMMSTLRGRLSMVLHWGNESKLEQTYNSEIGLNVRLHPSVKANRALAAAGTSRPVGPLSLYDCIGEFQRNERLDEDNLWYCSTCKEHRQAYKMMQLFSLPSVLVIQLKRFRSTARYRQKLGYAVNFPLQGLDLTPYVLNTDSKGWIYDCFAVVNHSGDLGGGHYTAFCKHNVTEKWYLFNDTSVSPVEPSSVVTSSAYILFYKKRT